MGRLRVKSGFGQLSLYRAGQSWKSIQILKSRIARFCLAAPHVF